MTMEEPETRIVGFYVRDDIATSWKIDGVFQGCVVRNLPLNTLEWVVVPLSVYTRFFAKALSIFGWTDELIIFIIVSKADLDYMKAVAMEMNRVGVLK